MGEETLGPIAELLRAQGLTAEDLAAFMGQSGEPRDTEVVTVKEYVEQVSAGLSEGTLRGYNTHFQRFINGVGPQCSCTCPECVKEWDADGSCSCRCGKCNNALSWAAAGGRPMRAREFTRTELDPFVEIAQRIAAKRATRDNARRAKKGLSAKPAHGQGGREMCVTALKCLFGRAFDDELIHRNPAEKLDKGGRSRSRRRALSEDELELLLEEVVSGGDDPELDLLITWAALELGARRGGLVSLAVGGLLTARQSISVLEKGRKAREQPASVELLESLLAHSARRGGSRCVPGHEDFDPAAPVLYYRDSTPERPHPLGRRRFDTLHRRIQRALPWANEMMYSGHAIRHTTGTIIERIAGTQVARVMLGHERRTPTDIYTDSTAAEVATAFSVMTGSPHPLASAD